MKDKILEQFFPCSQECKDKINELEDKFGMTTKCVCGQMIERAKLSKALDEYREWNIKEFKEEIIKFAICHQHNTEYMKGEYLEISKDWINICVKNSLTNKQ